MDRNYLIIFIAIANMYWSFVDQSNRLILPKIQYSDPDCSVDKLDYSEIEKYHKFVVYLNLNDDQTRDDFGKWVELSNSISKQLTNRAVFYVHSSECDPQLITALETVSNEHDILILYDLKSEFLAANNLRKIQTFSALVDEKNEPIYSSKSNYTIGIMEQFISDVDQLLDIKLPYVDPIPEIVKKDFGIDR